jgi:hypothetical protein
MVIIMATLIITAMICHSDGPVNLTCRGLRPKPILWTVIRLVRVHSVIVAADLDLETGGPRLQYPEALVETAR